VAVKLSISTESLTGVGSDLADLCDQMQVQIRELTSMVTLSAQTWGSDAQGSRFSAAYQPLVDDAIRAFTTHAAQVGEAGAGLRGHASGHIETESDHVAAHHALTDRIG
jgi:hypothetical protein